MNVRVRFAPSPTGYLHVGGLRTALYNYLFAKNQGGKCILRIEDTDRTRLVENAQANLIKSLRWAGIEFDESPEIGGDYGPYIQSERFDLYKKYGMQLIENGTAYIALDTSEELDAMRERQQKAGIAPKYDRTVMRNEFTLGKEETQRLIDNGATYCIRLKVPANEEIRFNDLIRGPVVVTGRDVDDQILLKSDGFPTYHLANVVDDHLMAITHVIRGEEWLPSTPKHVLLYQAFGWECPLFAHLPLLLNKDKSKLSKRQGSVAVEDFAAQGYFKEAFVNFIALLGWNPTADREIFTFQELCDTFNLEKVNKSGAVFDTQKLDWMNGQYLRSLPLDYLVELLKPELANYDYAEVCDKYLGEVINLLKERITFLKDVLTFGNYMFEKPKEYEPTYIAKVWKDNTTTIITPLIDALRSADDFLHDTTHDITMKYVDANGLKLKDVIHPLRLMITGKSVGAGMFETMAVLGKDECIERLDYFIKTKS
ncbi:MAG: glutamate--tRNA ligase [Ignavibacteria bacterium]|jgi:glutamyl-tRNA synthetase|nr:glutamate--tRNA ligase [Ignavibacteria bacterium]